MNGEEDTPGWQFAVVGFRNDFPKYLGFKHDYDDASKLRDNMIALGWRSVKIYDPNLIEVKKP